MTAALIEDHAYLLQRKGAVFRMGNLQSLSIACPESMLRIVIGNLLRNAAENSHDGVIEVGVVDRCLSIQDSGQGFDTVAAAQRYTQSLRGSTRAAGGQGLGLFLIRRICERFGWTLKISSSPAHGTLAQLWFPPQCVGTGHPA